MRLLPLCLSLFLAFTPRAGAAAVRVVATVPDLAALARGVGGDRLLVSSMSLPTQDPHFVDAKPSLALELSRADLLLLVGLDLEVGWLPVLMSGARNPAIQRGSRGHLDCSAFIRPLEVPASAIDRSMGDVHPGGNPHYLKDPRAAAEVARGIAARLSEIDPDGKSTYQERLEALLAELGTAQRSWEERLTAHRGAPFIAYHKTWVYIAQWLGLTELAFLEPKPGTPPNPQHVARVIQLGRANQARFILQESYYPQTTSELVAQKLGVPVVVVPASPDFRGGQTYVQFLDAYLSEIHRALGAGGTP